MKDDGINGGDGDDNIRMMIDIHCQLYYEDYDDDAGGANAAGYDNDSDGGRNANNDHWHDNKNYSSFVKLKW